VPLDDCGGGNWSATTTFCQVSQYLFIPSTQALEAVNTGWNDIQEKAPFAYRSLIATELSTVTASGTAVFTPTGALNTYLFAPLGAGIVALFWLSGGVFLFLLISTLLHGIK